MKYLSVCSGIEAATVAWHPLGWRALAYAEIERFPSAVLAHHYPDIPNLGDMTRYGEWPALRPDLLVGGTPCQSFSVAGLRKGLADPRGNLALVFLGLVDRLRPRWVVWENVPGVRSSGQGRDFGAFLGGLGELGYGYSYRSLDAQYFGLAQRRERVFVIGHLGDWRPPAAVLFEPESLSGHPPPRRETGEGVADTLASRAGAGGGLGTDFDLAGGIVSHDPACTLTAREYKGPLPEADLSTVVAHSLRADGFDASEDGTGRGTPLIPYAIQERAISENADTGPDGVGIRGDGVSYTLEARTVPQAVAFAENQRGEVRTSSIAAQLTVGGGKPGQGYPAVATAMQVRRLTPRECSRLQGFSDDYLELDKDADAEEAGSRAILRRVWIKAHQEANGVKGSIGELAALVSPQVLLAGVSRGWIPWSVARWGAASGGPLSRQNSWPEAAVRLLREYAEAGPSPYRREPVEQCARELGGPLSFLSYEGTSYASDLFAAVVQQSPSAERVLRQARTEVQEVWRSTGRGWQAGKRVADGPRYKALGNSMAVPVMRWIGERIQLVEDVMAGLA